MSAKSSIQAGDQLRCAACGHQRTITSQWLGELRMYFPARRSMILRSNDLARFKCSSFGEKSLGTVQPAVPAPMASTMESNALRKLALTVIAQAGVRNGFA